MNNLEKLNLVLDFKTVEKINLEGQAKVTVREIIEMCKENIAISKETIKNIEEIDENDNIRKMLDEGSKKVIEFNKEVIDALQFVNPDNEITFWKE